MTFQTNILKRFKIIDFESIFRLRDMMITRLKKDPIKDEKIEIELGRMQLMQ